MLPEAGLHPFYDDAPELGEEPVMASVAIMAEGEFAYLLHVAVYLSPHDGLLLHEAMEGGGFKRQWLDNCTCV